MHSLLEEYLGEVSAHLSVLPTARRTEELHELRTHLENAVIIGVEMGQTKDEAARAALVQFGAPTRIAENTVAAWRRGEAQRKCDLWGAATCTVAALFLVEFLVVRPLLAPYLGHPISEAQWAVLRWVDPSLKLIGFVVSGAATAAFFPRKAVSGAALGLAVWSCYWWGKFAVFATHAQFSHLVTLSLVGYAIQNVVGVAVVLLAAWAGSRWHRARMRRGRA